MTLEELKEHYMPIIELAVTRTKEYYEAQLKAKDELLDKLHKAYAEAEYACKAKDEEIRRLNNLYADTIKEVGKLDEDYSKVASDFESAVMEIERLKRDLTAFSMLLDEPKDTK